MIPQRWWLGVFLGLTLISGVRAEQPLDPGQAPLVLPLVAPVLEGPPPKFWSGGAELGMNGAEGNSNNFKFRLGGGAKHETPFHIFKTDFFYSVANINEQTSENRGELKARYESPFPNSPWSLFVSGTGLVDQFTAYDFRLAAHTGVAYNFIKTDTSLFKGRLGAGASREFGGPNDAVQPEGLVGLDVEHKFNKRYKLCGTLDYYPDFSSLGEYRMEGRMSLEILIDPDLNLTLKLGILDRYDSTPEGRRPNDLDYFAMLLWKF